MQERFGVELYDVLDRLSQYLEIKVDPCGWIYFEGFIGRLSVFSPDDAGYVAKIDVIINDYLFSYDLLRLLQFIERLEMCDTSDRVYYQYIPGFPALSKFKEAGHYRAKGAKGVITAHARDHYRARRCKTRDDFDAFYRELFPNWPLPYGMYPDGEYIQIMDWPREEYWGCAAMRLLYGIVPLLRKRFPGPAIVAICE